MHRMMKAAAVLGVVCYGLPAVAQAQTQERLCDPRYENCRTPLLTLIANEQQGIDVAFWYMSDARYSNAIVKRFQEGLPVRVLMDDRADDSKPKVQPILDQLKSAGIPMRRKSGGGILHWKMMLFDGQNVVQFSKANYEPDAFVYNSTTSSWIDEAIYFSDDGALVNTFRTKFDDQWINTSGYANYANITGPLVRRYPVFPQVSWTNFPPAQDFYTRARGRFDRETQRMDVTIFRLNDRRYADGILNAANRGVSVRLIQEPEQYRAKGRMYVWHAYNIDRLYMAGVAGKDVQIKSSVHPGLMHEMAVVLYGLGEVIFGSSNFTTPSSNSQAEHNVFYSPSVNKPWFYQWFVDQFDRKWSDTAAFQPFQPLPPDTPVMSAPANGAAGLSSSVTLKWDGREFAHKYDIYFGPSSSPPLLASDVAVGSPVTGQIETFTVQNLLPGTTYYWRIVGKTMANMTRSGPTWSFTTAGASGGGGSSTPFGGTPIALPGTIQVENFDNGGSGIAYADTTAGNAGGVYRGTDVDIGPASDSGGGYYVGWTRASEWLNYTVNVAQTGSYTLETRIAGVGTGARFHVEVDGVDVTGSMSVPDTGGWQTWQTISKSGISLTAGTRVVRLVFDQGTSQNSGVGNYNYLRFTTGTGGSGSTGAGPFSGTPVPVPGTLQAENFDTGGSGVAYVDTTAGNTGGAYRSTDVDLGPTTDVGGGYYVGWTRAGEWLKYSANVTQSGTYTLDVRIASRGTGASFHVEVDGTNVTGARTVPDTGGWQTWQTLSISGISLNAGNREVRLVFDRGTAENQGVGNYNYLRFR